MQRRSLSIPLLRFRAVTALRGLILVILAGVTLALALTYGSREKPQTAITMALPAATPPGEGPVVDQSDQFEINGTREGRPAFTLQASTVTGYAGERKLLEKVRLTLHDEMGGTVRVEGRTGHFDAASRRAQLIGDVRISGSDGMALETGTLFYDSDRDMIFTGDAVRFMVGGMTGSGQGLNYIVDERRLKIPDAVRLDMPADAVRSRPALQISAGDLVASLADHQAVFTDDVHMIQEGSTLRASYLKLTFDEEQRYLTGLQAFGEVSVHLERAAAAPAEMQSERLRASFAEGSNELIEAEASGTCRVSSSGSTSRSRSARYIGADDRLELRGDPVLLTAGERVAAEEIDIFPGADRLEARGEVRTVSLPSTSGESAPGFGSRAAVSFQAATLRADRAGGLAVYETSARAWQEGTSVQADTIQVDREARQLRASGHVMSRFTQRPAPGAPTASHPLVTAITADDMVVSDAQNRGVYTGGVTLTRQDATLTAERMEAQMRQLDGRRELDRIDATGSVQLRRTGSRGSGRTAEYLGQEDLLILRDEEGLAEVVDSATGRTMRGRALTFDLAGDRILTESERGGRTWITLTPESKDAPAVEPKTRH